MLHTLNALTKPWRSCIGLALSRAAIIVLSSFVVLVLLKILFQSTVVDRTEMLPYKENAALFGYISFVFLRASSTTPMAKIRPKWLPKILPVPVVYLCIIIIVYTAPLSLWFSFPQEFPLASTYLVRVFIPFYFIFSFSVNGMVFKIEWTRKSLTKYFFSVVIFPIILMVQLFAGLSCLVVTNTRNRRYLEEVDKSNQSIGTFLQQQLLTGLFVGVLYPLAKFGVIWASKKAYSFQTPAAPLNREQEILANTTEFGFVMGQKLIWDTIGYLLILRSPNALLFYITLSVTHSYNALYRICNSLWLRRQSRRKVQAENNTKDIENQIAPLKKLADESKSPSGMTASNIAEVEDYETHPNFFAASRNETANFNSFNILSRSTVASFIGKGNGGTSSVNDVVDKSHEKSLASDDRAKSTFSRKKTEKLEILPTLSSLPAISVTELPHHAGNDVTPQVVTYLPHDPATTTFTPLPTSVKYGFMRIGSLCADWSSYWGAFSVILLFATLPEAPRWSSTYYDAPFPILVTRLIIGSTMCMLVDIIALNFESRVLNVKFEDAVKESRIAKLSVASYMYFTASMCCVAGIYAVADTGLMFPSPTYIRGRSLMS